MKWNSEGRSYRIDSGFIVHNPTSLSAADPDVRELGVASQPTTMSFSVHNEATGLEYNAATLDTLFCQRRNCVAALLGMVRDLMRFYREAPALLDRPRQARHWATISASTGTVRRFATNTWCRWLPRCGPRPRRADTRISRPATWCSSWPTTRCCR